MDNNNAINPRLADVLNANVGNKITPELSAGMLATLQQLMNTIALEAYQAGTAAPRDGDSVAGEVTDVEPKR